jgi:light-regulated signal transduction histidine kinase (bacteriophytochrome)
MVASYLQLLVRRCEDKLTPEGKEFIGFAVDGAKRMQSLINEDDDDDDDDDDE